MKKPCNHLVCGKFCSKINTKCLEVRFFGGVDDCYIADRSWPLPKNGTPATTEYVGGKK